MYLNGVRIFKKASQWTTHRQKFRIESSLKTFTRCNKNCEAIQIPLSRLSSWLQNLCTWNTAILPVTSLTWTSPSLLRVFWSFWLTCRVVSTSTPTTFSSARLSCLLNMFLMNSLASLASSMTEILDKKSVFGLTFDVKFKGGVAGSECFCNLWLNFPGQITNTAQIGY